MGYRPIACLCWTSLERNGAKQRRSGEGPGWGVSTILEDALSGRRPPAIANNAPVLLRNPKAGRLVGIGAFPEAIEQNPIVYDLAFDIAWQSNAPDLKAWTEAYVTARYGRDVPAARSAWSRLRQSVYSQLESAPAMESPICAQPALALDKASPWGGFERNYDVGEVWTAWQELLNGRGDFGSVDTYRYDVVDVARQALADLSVPIYAEVAAAYKSGDRQRSGAAKARFMDLSVDLDTLLATRKKFLLGGWISDARRWGTTAQEKDLYERNARYLLTLWGPPSHGAFLHDYAWREWSGLISGFYVHRWEQFFAFLEAQAPGYSESGLYRVMDRPGDQSNDFYIKLTAWEAAWCDAHEAYSAEPKGDSLSVAGGLLEKWRPVMLEAYPHFAWKKSPSPAQP